jgi:ribosomal protein L20A (L18A)
MALKLAQATEAQKQAAFDKVYPELVNLAKVYGERVNIPFVNVEEMVMEKLRDPAVKQQMMEIIDDAVDAAIAAGPVDPSTGPPGPTNA